MTPIGSEPPERGSDRWERFFASAVEGLLASGMKVADAVEKAKQAADRMEEVADGR